MFNGGGTHLTNIYFPCIFSMIYKYETYALAHIPLHFFVCFFF